jgi:hypothetical protein
MTIRFDVYSPVGVVWASTGSNPAEAARLCLSLELGPLVVSDTERLEDEVPTVYCAGNEARDIRVTDCAQLREAGPTEDTFYGYDEERLFVETSTREEGGGRCFSGNIEWNCMDTEP